MKLILNLLLLASSRAAKDVLREGTPPPLKVVSNFLSPDEIQHFLDAELDGETGATTFYGNAIMPPAILGRLPRKQSDLEEHCSYADHAEGRPAAAIMTKMMTNTTHLHRDMMTGMGGVIGCDPPLPKDTAIDDDVGIIFLNTNKRAFFNREDTQVPAVAGTLVAFNGGFDHNTVVEDGSVRIAGPFHLKTLQYVYSACGTSCNPEDDNPDGTNQGCIDCEIESNTEEDNCRYCINMNPDAVADGPIRRNLEASNKASNKLNSLKMDAEKRLRAGSFEGDVVKGQSERDLQDQCTDYRCGDLPKIREAICGGGGGDSDSDSSEDSDSDSS